METPDLSNLLTPEVVLAFLTKAGRGISRMSPDSREKLCLAVARQSGLFPDRQGTWIFDSPLGRAAGFCRALIRETSPGRRRELAVTLAQDSSGTDGDLRLKDLPTCSEFVGLRIEEIQNATLLVGLKMIPQDWKHEPDA